MGSESGSQSHGGVLKMPKAVFACAAVLLFAPFFCLFLSPDWRMDRDDNSPWTVLELILMVGACGFYTIPRYVIEHLKLTPSTFYVGAFLQSLLLTCLVWFVLRALFNSRRQQLESRGSLLRSFHRTRPTPHP